LIGTCFQQNRPASWRKRRWWGEESWSGFSWCPADLTRQRHKVKDGLWSLSGRPASTCTELSYSNTGVQQRFRGFYTATVQDSNASPESHLQKYPSSVLFKKVYQAHYHRIRWTNLLHDSIAITCSFLHAIQTTGRAIPSRQCNYNCTHWSCAAA
jgi:hypothetical protein